MRNESDIIQIELMLKGYISLDLERIEEDSEAWLQASFGLDLEDPEQKEQAVFKYLGGYINRELFLARCPSTNGPGEVWPLGMEILRYGSGSEREGSSSSKDGGGSKEQGTELHRGNK